MCVFSSFCLFICSGKRLINNNNNALEQDKKAQRALMFVPESR